jgi:hypothetical protein
VLSVKPADQPAFVALMCGGCASKWTYGTTVTLKPVAAPEAPRDAQRT